VAQGHGFGVKPAAVYVCVLATDAYLGRGRGESELTRVVFCQVNGMEEQATEVKRYAV
jgi:hypothetical protein